MELTLATFNEVNREMFRSTLQPVEHALMDAKMSSRDIHEIILIGGSTRIRKIQELLEQYFEGKVLGRPAVACVVLRSFAESAAAATVQEDKPRRSCCYWRRDSCGESVSS